MSNDKPFTVIDVLCNPKRVRRVALTCQCNNRWIEPIPGELEDADVALRFHCPKCKQAYILHDKQLVKEEKFYARGQNGTDAVGQARRADPNDTKQQFDA